MTSPNRTCLFCRGPIEDCPSREHMIPDSLGGWLHNFGLCVACNSRLGSEVDKVANEPLLQHLRREAGLAVDQPLEVELLDHDIGQMVRGQIAPDDGIVDRTPSVHRVGDQVFIHGPSPEAVLRAAETMQRRRPGSSPLINFDDVVRIEHGPVLVSIPQRLTNPEELNRLMGREAAKVAVEYIDMLAGPSVALDARLDPLRVYARFGTGDVNPDVGVIPASPVWLPRTRFTLGVGEKEPPAEQMEALASELTRRPASAPPGSQVLSDVQHEVRIDRDRRGAWFGLVLFSFVRVMLELPPDLPLPWGRADFRNFTRPRRGTLHHF